MEFFPDPFEFGKGTVEAIFLWEGGREGGREGGDER